MKLPSQKIDGLVYGRDIRREPDDARQVAFKGGWTSGVASHANRDDESHSEKECSYQTLADRLTWWNLGYRLGRLFKETSVGLVEEMYQWSKKQYLESKAKRPD